ncbi:Hypothetical protein FKW44_025173 [Caligus rogercresseyi]|uniref:Uncharacterized protein n=1 Tax=Caligus rogercresseyi TaxID=217165 RepID=A0A7T8GKA5_CALRO|nr:Hypothetical protein FKW44_025173 [Caligus rogercresseyi]
MVSSLTRQDPIHDWGQSQEKRHFSLHHQGWGRVELHPSDEIEFLGVKFDSDFTTTPHNAYVVKAAKQRVHSSQGWPFIFREENTFGNWPGGL